MAQTFEPMIKLDPNGTAPILSYNVPEPTSYSGRNFIELKFNDKDEEHDKYFKEPFRKKNAPSTSKSTNKTMSKNVDTQTLRSSVLSSMKAGFNNSSFFSNAKSGGSSLYLAKKKDTEGESYEVRSNAPVSDKLSNLDADEVTQNIQAGMKLHIYTNMYGTKDYKYIPQEPQYEIKPHIYIVEIYKLTTRLGDYGAGKVIKTFSLLPGEKTKISVKSYRKTTIDSKQTSSILDSFTEESAEDFESSLQEEQSDKQNSAKTTEYFVEGEASANWGWGSASVKAGFKESSNSSREQFSKNVSNAVSKHSNKASAKRDVQVNTSYEVKEENGEETSIEREIQNINLSRTLNFVFRQMNQEYITVLHLVDVRIAFFNGLPESRIEVPLSSMDDLLDKVLEPAKKVEVRDYIVNQLKKVRDANGNYVSFIEDAKDDVAGIKQEYFRVSNIEQEYEKPVIAGSSTLKFKVKGVITSATLSIMRTEGIIVEAMLGEGLALDRYATQLQELEVEKKKYEIAKLKAEAERVELINKIAKENDKDKAEVLKSLLHQCCSETSINFNK